MAPDSKEHTDGQPQYFLKALKLNEQTIPVMMHWSAQRLMLAVKYTDL
jgi:hypothetical protein